MDKPFQVLLRVRYTEVDSQFVVFNARFGDYVGLAVTEYMRALFGSYQGILELGYDYQVARLATDFHSSAKYDDVLAISVELSRIGNTSFAFNIAFREFFTDRLIAVSEIVHVMMRYPDYEKVSVPDFFREKINLGLRGSVVNYAGVDLNSIA